MLPTPQQALAANFVQYLFRRTYRNWRCARDGTRAPAQPKHTRFTVVQNVSLHSALIASSALPVLILCDMGPNTPDDFPVKRP